jgi:hypothetical protein
LKELLGSDFVFSLMYMVEDNFNCSNTDFSISVVQTSEEKLYLILTLFTIMMTEEEVLNPVIGGLFLLFRDFLSGLSPAAVISSQHCSRLHSKLILTALFLGNADDVTSFLVNYSCTCSDNHVTGANTVKSKLF